jgi:hypothetical protein
MSCGFGSITEAGPLILKLYSSSSVYLMTIFSVARLILIVNYLITLEFARIFHDWPKVVIWPGMNFCHSKSALLNSAPEARVRCASDIPWPFGRLRPYEFNFAAYRIRTPGKRQFGV